MAGVDGARMAEPQQAQLEFAAAEIEMHVSAGGWDQRPALFALVRAAELPTDERAAVAKLGLPDVAEALTPVEQEALPDGPLDDVLARIGWPETVAGCALCQEIVILPPGAAGDVTDGDASAAVAHPEHHEARLVVAVLRDGTRATLLRLRDGTEPTGRVEPTPAGGELLTGPNLAPNLADALLATLRPD
jgi:hypothetical protein